MSNQSERIKNQLRSREEQPSASFGEKDQVDSAKNKLPKSRRSRNMIGILLIALMVFFIIKDPTNLTFNPLKLISAPSISVGGPSTDLLNSMNARMIEMGYIGLDHDDLRALRRDGVTATYISNVRALGYTELTLDEAVSLAKADASSAFIAMMIELGYTLTVEDIVSLRGAGVTAHYTSNVHDLGYRDVTKEQLIRMRRIGVTPRLIERLQTERGADIPLEDIIRHRISNQ